MELADKDKEATRLHEEHERRRLIRRFEKLFRKIDADDSGHISREELAEFAKGELHRELTDVLSVTDPLQIFQELDVDRCNAVSIDEFCHVLWQEAVSKVPVELRRIDKRVEYLTSQLRELGLNLGVQLASRALSVETLDTMKSMRPGDDLRSIKSSRSFRRVRTDHSTPSDSGMIRFATNSTDIVAMPASESEPHGDSIGEESGKYSWDRLVETKDEEDSRDDAVPDRIEDDAINVATDKLRPPTAAEHSSQPGSLGSAENNMSALQSPRTSPTSSLCRL
eukprot:TRINITY_DN18509_c0_g1_i3.p1 TRINITY_DN18509_c0_g1~~TRINITY_DN18509_c0_g1_i3.p1  ORF type:complete len:307 (-),score=61.62 TRINITY_DN18509_c0_g1_i3:210-1052(-)